MQIFKAAGHNLVRKESTESAEGACVTCGASGLGEEGRSVELLVLEAVESSTETAFCGGSGGKPMRPNLNFL